MVAAWPFFMCILYAATASPNTQYSSVSDECLANENEVRACGSECQTTCATSNQVCPIVNVKCNDACYCVEGYARDQNGRCIPDTSYECERLKPGKCPVNEMYSCGSACQTRCETLGQTCPIVNIKCNEGCYCIEGYARNQQNICIRNDSLACHTINHPTKKCGKNEIYDCNGACQTTCETYGQNCPTQTFACVGNCFCKAGFARNKSGECILANSTECELLKPCIN